MFSLICAWTNAGANQKSNNLHIEGLVQERRKSIANALELRLSCTNPSICIISFRKPMPHATPWWRYGMETLSALPVLCERNPPAGHLTKGQWYGNFDVSLLLAWTTAEWVALQWRHNGRDGVTNHRRLDFYSTVFLFRRRSKKTSKLRVTGLCRGNSPVTG